jgi:integrase
VRRVDVELDATRPSLTINGTTKTERGKGTYRKGSSSSDASVRTVVLPGFAIGALKHRHAAAPGDLNASVFPTRNGTWQQVNNVERRWRQVRKDTGLDWVTPHTFRKTVATVTSERVDAETASHQVGHSARQLRARFSSQNRRSLPMSHTSRMSWPRNLIHMSAQLTSADRDASLSTMLLGTDFEFGAGGAWLSLTPVPLEPA